MATTIKIKRGLKTNLPTLAVGEVGYCTDTNELFIGTANGNELINEDTDISQLTNIGDVNVSDLSENEILVYDGSEWVNKPYDFVPPVTLGVEWDQDTDSLTRLDDAVGLTAGGDFDSFNHYQLRRCMVNNDLSINYYIDPADPNDIGEVVNTGTYTTGDAANYTGSHGQVMVEIPKFWWKYDEPTSDQYQWRISDADQAGYDVHPAFITDGVTKDYIYMSAFEAGWDGAKLTSVSGVEQRHTRTITEFRTEAQARGTGWQIQTYWATHALQLLYLIEYADFDSKTTIGRGVLDNANFHSPQDTNTGATISLGNSSGMVGGTNGLVPISYRGVENLWGNLSKYIDGLQTIGTDGYVANENFETVSFPDGPMPSAYTSIGPLLSNFENGFISDIQFPHFLATEVSGSSTSHLHDDYQAGDDRARVASFGGYFWSDGLPDGGLFSWRVSWTPTYSDRPNGTRIQIL